eukprot:TRINITY_DN15026_c0_g1_i1.p1 TRINITY_DN15026_c0_g1~~TRINITY_DN15026_c0_g1_i1.p1  ORF type:complete len:285 (+),score=34.92 TRINITY_DN15026_c0_g1_i1:1294-2148(+)
MATTQEVSSIGDNQEQKEEAPTTNDDGNDEDDELAAQRKKYTPPYARSIDIFDHLWSSNAQFRKWCEMLVADGHVLYDHESKHNCTLVYRRSDPCPTRHLRSTPWLMLVYVQYIDDEDVQEITEKAEEGRKRKKPKVQENFCFDDFYGGEIWFTSLRPVSGFRYHSLWPILVKPETNQFVNETGAKGDALNDGGVYRDMCKHCKHEVKTYDRVHWNGCLPEERLTARNAVMLQHRPVASSMGRYFGCGSFSIQWLYAMPVKTLERVILDRQSAEKAASAAAVPV